MSVIVPIRLSEDELAKLDEIVSSPVTGAENRTELFRLLLHREYNRRKGLPKPKASDLQTAFRTGRPAWGTERWKRALELRRANRITQTERIQ